MGDPQEAKAIYNAFCAKCDRKDPLPIGLVKSNIGHAEGASGASSVAKVLIVFENECIPASLHLKKMKHLIEPYCPPLLPIKENYKYNPSELIIFLSILNRFLIFQSLLKRSLESTTLVWVE